MIRNNGGIFGSFAYFYGGKSSKRGLLRVEGIHLTCDGCNLLMEIVSSSQIGFRRATTFIADRPEIAVVCGRRRERFQFTTVL